MNATQAIEEAPVVIKAAEVAKLVGVDVRTIRREAQDKESPYFKARILDGIATLRFRRADIEAIVHGPSAKVLSMRGTR
jgi:hypothetical protein